MLREIAAKKRLKDDKKAKNPHHDVMAFESEMEQAI
jgi:hypothetical protein